MEFSTTLSAETSEKAEPYSFTESLAWSPLIHQHERGAIFPAKCRLTAVPSPTIRAYLAPLGHGARRLHRGPIHGGRYEIVAVHRARFDARVVAPAAGRTDSSGARSHRSWKRAERRCDESVAVVRAERAAGRKLGATGWADHAS